MALMAISILSACTSKKEEGVQGRSITYEMKTFTAHSKNCADDSTKCATFEVQYPVFTGLDTTISRIVQQKIDSMLNSGLTEGFAQTIEQSGNTYIQEYEEFVTMEPDMPSMGWYHSAYVTVPVATDSLIVLSVSSEDYSGGAHPNSSIVYVNLDPHTGGNVGLDRFLKPGYKDALTAIGEKVFRRERELSDTTSFSSNFFEFQDDKFALNDNFGFTPEGIVFYYNSYEVAPYAAGPTEVIIPYLEIKDWLK